MSSRPASPLPQKKPRAATAPPRRSQARLFYVTAAALAAGEMEREALAPGAALAPAPLSRPGSPPPRSPSPAHSSPERFRPRRGERSPPRGESKGGVAAPRTRRAVRQAASQLAETSHVSTLASPRLLPATKRAALAPVPRPASWRALSPEPKGPSDEDDMRHIGPAPATAALTPRAVELSSALDALLAWEAGGSEGTGGQLVSPF